MPTVVSYSGGAQSKALAIMTMRGEIQHSLPLAVCFADTGGEHRERYGAAKSTYEEVDHMRGLCAEHGVDFIEARAELSLNEKWMADVAEYSSYTKQPPLYVIGRSKNRISQRCTYYAKIQPMRQAVAQWLCEHKLPKHVTKFIGLTYDEVGRVASFKHDRLWEVCEFPLFYHGITKSDCTEYLRAIGETIPTRSLCTWCPHKTRTQWIETIGVDLEQARSVDQLFAEHGWLFGFDDAYLSSSYERIGEVTPGRGTSKRASMHCDSGHCFI